MYIEDIIIKTVAAGVKLNRFDKHVFESFTEQIFKGNAFTAKQSALALKICQKYQSKINLVLNIDISSSLEHPSFKLGQRVINHSRKMTISENEQGEKFIKVEFPFDELILKKIRAKKTDLFDATWDGDIKSWKFSLDEQSLNFLYELYKEFNFICDDVLQSYMEEIQVIRHNIEKYIPLVSLQNQKSKIKNSKVKIPEEIDSDILKSLFFARKHGILTWDNCIVEALEAQDTDKSISCFLNNDPLLSFKWNREKYQDFSVFKILKYLLPVLIIIPQNKELLLLQKTIKNLNDIGVNNENISVLFRLQSEKGSDFNNFVKDQQLNNPLNEKTQICFVSGKIPKTIFLANIKFHGVLNYNSCNVHYTIQEFVKNTENVIMLNESIEKEDEFWQDVE